MFGTIIVDAYRKEDIIEMANAIDDLCSPNDSYGWASAGIYCFWDYYIEEILYIGLAVDLCERFKQHNGILPLETGSKQKQIEEYFDSNDRLGYSIFVQSPLSQPATHRNRSHYEEFARQVNSPIDNYLDEQGKRDIQRVEGILIEAYRKKYEHFPPWNKIGGSLIGQNLVTENTINILKGFCSPDLYYLHPLMSRSTLRELSDNAEYAAYENFLHAVRMNMLILGLEYNDALNLANKHDSLNYSEKITESGYYKKRLIL